MERLDELLNYLETNITDTMPLEDIVSIFEQMCQIPVENSLVLFETGTFSITREPRFYFSLTRQFPNGGEDYPQIHVDVQYKAAGENRAFQTILFSENLQGNIFDCIRNSPDFVYAKSREYVQVDIYMDET